MAMKKAIVTRQGTGLAAALVAITMAVLLAANSVQGQSCEIVNGSFEDDGYIADITVKEPNGWDVNLPAGKFKGFVDNDWSTDPSYSLTLRTQTWKTFSNGDTATVSQEVDLTDANEILFDLKLENWNSDKVSAVMLVDSDVVWDSNELGSGTYYDQIYTVEDKYRDGAQHTVSFGIRAKVSEMLYVFYVTKWDYIECTEFCGGGGLLAGDFDHNCYVDINDLELFAEVWLSEVEKYDRYNLFKGDDGADDGGTVTFSDFAVFGLNWQQSSYIEPNEP
jgi:hypothetical protein